ncbi:hypothetical protein NB646_05885 [Oxalobacter aliiformigenes]|uniref:Uncharacterized protein n=1 Tax=Oxalobacter aliiformigenes TaxID=2946593 RepID=A0A9E9NS87_9BURK|nr:hypothetical protein [Oxalobacter aliiformigenes]WAV90403.1 hypothetical protein NB646_05885 [Oxalobacter aliiformigenes]
MKTRTLIAIIISILLTRFGFFSYMAEPEFVTHGRPHDSLISVFGLANIAGNIVAEKH